MTEDIKIHLLQDNFIEDLLSSIYSSINVDLKMSKTLDHPHPLVSGNLDHCHVTVTQINVSG